MTNLIKFEIVTPERTILKEQIVSITVPTTEGELTILAHHIPIVSILKPGIIQIRKDGGEIDLMAVSGGFIEVLRNKIVIMADTAERAQEIDEARAEEARQRAEELMKNIEKSDDIDFASISANMAKELARIKTANKWKNIKHPHNTLNSEKK